MGVASRASVDVEPSPAGHRNWDPMVWALERADAPTATGVADPLADESRSFSQELADGQRKPRYRCLRQHHHEIKRIVGRSRWIGASDD